MKKLILILAALGAGLYYYSNEPAPTPADTVPSVQEAAEPAAESETALLSETDAAYEEKRSNVQVEGSGTVSRVLPDDNKGSKHQRFVLRLDSGLTVLVAHNVDLAPRIEALQQGDEVGYYGEYEWNQKGGVIHWTHHDPRGTHAGGWLRHKGRTYQ
ncbi:DUF3465 domain-containing protein [Pseudoduganella sp. GCM10020061]|uniref:DUF3465 domain-containing protein n=1 Tax=Pseudoduganella sp. GCM10020061 TaxID=3317345 RepID=UPI00363FA9F9